MKTNNIKDLATSVTPHDAVALLKVNHVNRNPRNGNILAWRKDMDHGRWALTGEPIIISDKGFLLDGQNRLMALAGAQVESVQFVVIEGVEEMAQSVMDSGSARTIADALKLEFGHVQNITQVASLARWLAVPVTLDANFRSSVSTKVSTAEGVASFRDDQDGIAKACQEGRSLYDKFGKGSSMTSLSYLWYRLQAVDAEANRQFWWAMTEMSFQTENDPRKAAFRRLTAIALDMEPSTTIKNVATVSVATRAWNSWRKGEEVTNLNWNGPRGIIAPVEPV